MTRRAIAIISCEYEGTADTNVTNEAAWESLFNVGNVELLELDDRPIERWQEDTFQIGEVNNNLPPAHIAHGAMDMLEESGTPTEVIEQIAVEPWVEITQGPSLIALVRRSMVGFVAERLNRKDK